MKTFDIPRIIHLCWFSGDEYPEIIKTCIQSWERELPDFKIKIWTKEMALATNIDFVKEAIEVKKWAFAADVIRLYALYTDGGVYMDSDIAVRGRFDDFMTNSLVLFQEYHSQLVKNSKSNNLDKNGYNLNVGQSVDGIGIQAAFMMSQKGHSFVKTLLAHYVGRHFVLEDGSFDVGVIAPSIYASYAEKIGYRYVDEMQTLEDITIYPSKHVSPSFTEIKKESFALHCCSHSWFEPSLKQKIRTILVKAIRLFTRSTNENTNIGIVNNFLSKR